MEGGKLMARGLYKNLVTHLVMLEGEGLIETEDIAVAVVEAQQAATKKGFKLYQHINDQALVGRAKATLEEASLSLMDMSDLLTPVKVQKEKVREKQSSGEGELGRRKEEKVKEGKEKEEVMLLQMETDAARELSGRGDEKDGKRRRRSLKEEWLVRINNRMEKNEKKEEEKDMETDKKEESMENSSFLSLSSSSTDSMPVLSDQSKEGPCLLLSSPPILDVKTLVKNLHWECHQQYLYKCTFW